MTQLKAHFDGRSFVPDEAVDVPAGWVGMIRLIPSAKEETPVGSATQPNPLEDFYREPEDCSADLGLPTDLSINYRHYLYGAPKRD